MSVNADITPLIMRPNHYKEIHMEKKPYTVWHGLFDVTMIILTKGLWMIYILLRYYR